MKAKMVIILAALAAAAVGLYALAHRPKPASTTITPRVSASRASSANPAKSSATPAPAASTATTSCGTSDLSLTLDTTGGGTAGTVYRQAILANQSAKPCTIGGFPGVSLVDADDQQVGQPAKRTGPSAPTITLAPGQSAAATIGFPNPSNFQGGTCTEQSFSLKLYPPGQTTALETPLKAQACPGFSTQALQHR